MVGRVLLGHLGGGVYGLRVSKPGIEVQTATGVHEILYDSSRSTMRFITQGKVVLAANVQQIIPVAAAGTGALFPQIRNLWTNFNWYLDAAGPVSIVATPGELRLTYIGSGSLTVDYIIWGC